MKMVGQWAKILGVIDPLLKGHGDSRYGPLDKRGCPSFWKAVPYTSESERLIMANLSGVAAVHLLSARHAMLLFGMSGRSSGAGGLNIRV